MFCLNGARIKTRLHVKEEWFPVFIYPACRIFNKHNMIGGIRFNPQFHLCFIGSFVSLFIIAWQACGNQVFPVIRTASRFWYNMIQRKRKITPAAVSAFMPVSAQNIFSCKNNSFEWNVNKIIQPDNAGPGKSSVNRVKYFIIPVGNHFGFPQEDQYHGLFYVTD